MADLHIEIPPDEPVISFERLVRTPVAVTFALFTQAEHLRRWWGPRHLELVTCDIDLRVGGRYRFVQQAPDGQRYTFEGEYLSIDEPHRLQKTFVFDGRPDNEAVDTFTFDEHPEGTLVRCRTVHSSIAARDQHAASGAEGGLTDSYRRLGELAADLQKGPAT